MPNKPKSAAIWNPFTAKSRAAQSAQEMYPGKIGQDDQRDAARHMLASGYLAKAWSPGVADLIGKAHEFKETPFRHLGALAGMAQHRYDRPIDLHNNTLGIELAQKAGSMEEFERLVNEAAERARPTQTPGVPWVPSEKDAEAMRKGSAQYQAGGLVKGGLKTLDNLVMKATKGRTAAKDVFASDFQTIPEKELMRMNSIEREQRVPIQSIVPTQPDVKTETALEYMMSNRVRDPGTKKMPEVVKWGDKYYIMDGHHRVAGQLALDKTDIPVQVIGEVPALKKADGGLVAAFKDGGSVAAFQDGGAAFGVFPQMKPRRTRQDPEAAKNVPVDLARGFVAGTLGMPGDVESLVRMLPGLDESRTILPTSEEIEKRLPLRSDTPVSRAASGLGILGGGFYTGPGSAARAITAVPGAIKRAGVDFAQAAGQSGPNVIKNKGGNFIDDSLQYFAGKLKRGAGMAPEELADMERHLLKAETTWDLSTPQARREMAAMRDHFNTVKANQSLDTWVDQKFSPYVKNQMGTPEDPIRKLIEQGVYHMPEESLHTMGFLPEEVAIARRSAGFPEEGMAVQRYAERGFPEAEESATRAAEGWEAATDSLLNPKHAFEFRGEDLANNPWISKLDPNTPIHDIPAYESPRHLGFDHVLDVLREDLTTGRIRPEQLSKITMEQAVRRTFEYDQELAKKAQQTAMAAREGLPVYKEYPEGGMRWIELNRPGSFASESNAMGHSVRGYEPPKGHPDWVEGSGDAGSLGYGHGGWEAIKSGRAKVYSLVDEKGKPHVTVEVKSGRKLTEADLPDDVRDDLAEAYGGASREEFEAAVQRALAAREIPQQITQIKGKQNAAPKEDYLPFVQDFVRSGQWGDVGDLQNTGLIKHESGKYISKAEMNALSRKHFGETMGNKPDASESPEQYYRRMSRYDPEYLSETDKAFVEDWKAGNFDLPEGYAGGGSVKTGIKEGVDLARRSLFGLRPSQDMAGRELAPVQRDLDRMQAELAKAEKVAPKVEQKTTTVTPSPTAPKIEQTVKSIAETPMSRRTVLKSAAGQAIQGALPASSFADLMKPATVVKQAVQAAAPAAAVTASSVPALMAKAVKMGMDSDEALAFVKRELGESAETVMAKQDPELLYDTLKDPFESIVDDPEWLYKFKNGKQDRLMGPGELLQVQLGQGETPGPLKETLRALKAEMSPEDYANMKNAMKDAINQEIKYGGDY